MNGFNSFLDIVNIKQNLSNRLLFGESKDSDIKDLKKSFDEFNKEFFNNEIPDIEIKITDKDTDHSKGVAGSFNHFKSVGTSIHSNKTGSHFNLADLNGKLKKSEEEERAYNYFVNNSYIELPKDIVKKGKYYFYSVLLHEMVHAWITLCTNNKEKDPHGKAFRKKVDEINKKSNNEYRVAYEEVPQELVSDKPINERPDDLNESIIKDEDYIEKLRADLELSIYENFLAHIKGTDLDDFNYDVTKHYKLPDGIDAQIKIYDKKDTLVGYINIYETHILNIIGYDKNGNEVFHEISDFSYMLDDSLEKVVRTLINPTVTDTIVNYESNLKNNSKIYENVYLGRQDSNIISKISKPTNIRFIKNNGKYSNIEYASKKDYESIDDPSNIEYKKGWIQKRNPEPEKFHNKFKNDEKNGIII